MLLAIDTSAGTSVALVEGEIVVAEASSDDTRSHAELVGVLIARCIDGVDIATISGVVAGMGPGPFTGLRVGIAAARAFALGVGRPVLPIASHDAIAWGVDEPIVVTTDARRREVFWSAYGGLDAAGIPIRTHGPALAPVDHAGLPGHRLIPAHTVSAAHLGLLAAAMLAAGRPFAVDQALYLRSPDVTVSAGPKRVTG
jgi:tRNA threonylcarbamoyl adenosine modification protein YeaZ